MTTSIGSPTRAELSETPTTTGPATAPAPLRLVLSTHPGHGSLDGAWWPRSRNLATELADLVDHFPTSAGRVIRAVYSPPDWLPVSRRVDIARGYIKVGSFPHDDTHVLALRLSTGEVLRLLVVPPGTPADEALAVMKLAASPTTLSATTLLVSVHRNYGEEPVEHWNDDGGSWWDPHPTPPSQRPPR